MRNLSEEAAVNTSSQRNIHHRRDKRNMLLNPQTSNEIPKLPQEYQITTNGDQFLVLGSGIRDPERTFIFASELGLQLLS